VAEVQILVLAIPKREFVRGARRFQQNGAFILTRVAGKGKRKHLCQELINTDFHVLAASLSAKPKHELLRIPLPGRTIWFLHR
jgi:hypothetical protein